VLLLAVPRGAAGQPVGAGTPAGSDRISVVWIEGEPYLGVNDLARLLETTKYWRPDVRKLVLRGRAHRVVLTVDNPFVVIDEHTVRLRLPVRTRAGELQVPLAIVESLPSDSTMPRLIHGPGIAGVLRVPSSRGALRTPQFFFGDSITRIAFPNDRPQVVTLLGRTRERFRLRLEGTFTGVVPESLPARSLAHSIRIIPSVTGTAFELIVSPEAQGYRILTDPSGRVATLELTRGRAASVQDFAPEEVAPGRGPRVIMLDPGHGGADRGVEVGGVAEKDLTLALARLVKAEVERRMPVRVMLTREDDRALSAEQRAERVNHARADAVIALHFDGLAGTTRRGATAWCPPPRPGAREGSERRNAPVPMLSWREVSRRHAVRSRALGEALLGAMELRGQGPSRLRERLTTPLLGMNAPALMLECATLTSSADRARLLRAGGLRELAQAIAEGIVTYLQAGR
jgi:N-acetylmuramoyl-L-alanine amidase